MEKVDISQLSYRQRKRIDTELQNHKETDRLSCSIEEMKKNLLGETPVLIIDESRDINEVEVVIELANNRIEDLRETAADASDEDIKKLMQKAVDDLEEIVDFLK